MDKLSNEAAHEILVAAMERQSKRLFILCLVVFLAFVASNAYWIWKDSQFVDEITVTQDTPNGSNNYVGRDGNITNGSSDNN